MLVRGKKKPGRKNGHAGNRGDQDAGRQTILMSAFFTPKTRGHDPAAAIQDALAVYLKTSQLPSLSEQIATNG
ncbi:MAG: hypothetical protein KJ052_11680 [Candidatus Hydrogenedentes bacterium]|nr:hypothetical protein [Candidatus Hydrogenedentota bacterium]